MNWFLYAKKLQKNLMKKKNKNVNFNTLNYEKS